MTDTVTMEVSPGNLFNEFIEKYIDLSTGKLKDNHDFNFIMSNCILDDGRINLQIIFRFYLIAIKYSNTPSTFTLRIETKYSIIDSEEQFRINSLVSIFSDSNSKVSIFINGNIIKNSSTNLKFRRMLPLLHIDKDLYNFLNRKIDKKLWGKIRDNNLDSFDKRKDERILMQICHSLLFDEIGNGNTILSKLRSELFETNEFAEVVQEISILSLLIFGMNDFAFREESVEMYKNLVRKYESKKATNSSTDINDSKKYRVRLNECDFLYGRQKEQKRINYEINEILKDKGYDCKTLYKFNDIKTEIHPFIIKEIFEAISISEGILQLIDNILTHAKIGREANGQGLLLIYLHNLEKDINYFSNLSKTYAKTLTEMNKDSKYIFELMIGDLSFTSMGDKFKKEHKECSSMTLKSFFSPNEEETKFWDEYYMNAENVIHHYGLQIFDSIVSSKGGFFEVKSGNEIYRNYADNLSDFYKEIPNSNIFGTQFNILIPYNTSLSSDKNIYDSMLIYDDLNSEYLEITFDQHDLEKINKSNQKYNTIEMITDKLRSKDREVTKAKLSENNTINLPPNHILCIVNMKGIHDLEILVKGVLAYIYSFKDESSIYLAFIGCKTYQIIEIVRIISLFFNKNSKSIHMSNVQIFIKGNNVGEEIIIFGDSLESIKENIYRCSSFRGYMFENILTINSILSRGGIE